MDEKVSTAEKRAASIRKAVRSIKRGSFLSYGEVARRAGLPGRARLVGQVLRESGDAAKLPWHRVTAAGGRIAFPAGSASARRQLQRLAKEGVQTRGNRAVVARTASKRTTIKGAARGARTLDELLWKL